jgi:hypothetical protein
VIRDRRTTRGILWRSDRANVFFIFETIGQAADDPMKGLLPFVGRADWPDGNRWQRREVNDFGHRLPRIPRRVRNQFATNGTTTTSPFAFVMSRQIDVSLTSASFESDPQFLHVPVAGRSPIGTKWKRSLRQ